MTLGVSRNGRKYTLTTLLESLNALPPINFSEDKNHEIFMQYLIQLFKISKFNEENAYEFFYNMHPDIQSGVFDTSVINGSLLFLKNVGGLAGADMSFFKDKSNNICFTIKDNDASFITKYITIYIKGFNNPISEISVVSHNKSETKITDMNYVSCKFTLETLMKCIATILTWQYNRSNISRRVKPVGGENE